MKKETLLAIMFLAVLLSAAVPVWSTDPAPHQGLTPVPRINPDAPRYHDLAAVESEAPPFPKPAESILSLATPTVLLPPIYFCEYIDYSGGQAYYFWKIPDVYNTIEFGMRFIPSENFNCTLLTAYVGIYGTYLGNNPAGTPDMRVTVYSDDGFGLPGDELGHVVLPFDSLPTSGLAYVPVDLTSLGPLVFVDGEEFHVGVSVENFQDGDTLALLSDDGSAGLERSWDNWDGVYNLMLVDWGNDVNFLLGVDVCCDEIPFIYCEDVEYDCGPAYYWKQPDAYGDEYFNMRFSPGYRDSLVSVGVALYQTPMTGTPDLEVYVWGGDGSGFPDLARELVKVTVPHDSLVFYPDYNVVDVSSLGLIFEDDYFVGWATAGMEGDTLAGLSDDGGCGTGRSSEYWNGGWHSILDDWGVDVNFLIRTHVCYLPPPSPCTTLAPYCNITYAWTLPDRYGDVGNYQRFSPPGPYCQLERFRLAFYDPGLPGAYSYNSEVQIYGTDPINGLPDPTDLLGIVTLTPGDYVLYPGWTEIDIISEIPNPVFFDDDIWIGVESMAPDTLTGIATLSDDGSCGSYSSAEKLNGDFYYMADDWGVDVNFVFEIDICCQPPPPSPCFFGEDWPTAGKDFNRCNRSFSSLGNEVRGGLVKAWQYDAPQIMAYSSPVVYRDTLVGYYLDHLIAVDLNDGSEIWRRPSDGFEIGGGCYCTPTIYNFGTYNDPATLIFTSGGDTKAFSAINLADGSTRWTRDFMDHNLHFTTFGTSVIVDIGGVPLVIYNDDDGDIYAVEALTGNLYSGWTVNPVNCGGAVMKGVTLGSYNQNLYIGTLDNITNGDIVCLNPIDGSEIWRLSTSGGLQLANLDPNFTGVTESFSGMIAFNVVDITEPTLFACSNYDAAFATPPYRAGGVVYSLDAEDGSLNWANYGIGLDYQGLVVDENQVINNGWTPWVPGYGEIRGPIAFRKNAGTVLWKNTTTNPGLGDFWLMDGIASCENYEDGLVPDWYVVNSRSNFVGFYEMDAGGMVFHRRWVDQGLRAGHRAGTIMTDGRLLVTWRNKTVCMTEADQPRPRLDIPAYSISVPAQFGLPDHSVVTYENAIGNRGGAALTIDSVVLSDVDNGTSPPPSASLNIVDHDHLDNMSKMADMMTGSAARFREVFDVDPPGELEEIASLDRSHRASVLPAWIYGIVHPAPGTVIPPPYSHGDSSTYINISVEIDGTAIPRGYHPFYARVFSDDPDYFLDSARIDDNVNYGVPQIQLAIVGGCLYDDVVMEFGVGAANYCYVWNATKIADGDITSVEIDGDDVSFWQGAYIFATDQAGTPPAGKPYSVRVAHYAENWSAADPASWQSILADPNCYDASCPPNHRTNVLLGTISSDEGASYDDVYGEVVVYAFVDSVQNFCEYDTLGNCLHWLWDYAKPGEYGVQAPYDDTLTMGFHACASVIGAYDEPLLNNFVIHRFDFDGRYGPVDDVFMGAMLDYDIPSGVRNVAGFDDDYSLAWAYDCLDKTIAWGMVKIPWGDGYEGMINARSTSASQSTWNDSSVWLDSVYYWMSSLTGLSHQAGIDPVACPTDPDDREAFFTLAELDMPGNPDRVTVGVAVFGLPALTDASVSDEMQPLATIANQWCGFGRGNVNNDDAANIVDIAYLIDYVFYGGNGPYPFEHLGDVNCDDAINGLDITAMIQYYFHGGPAPCGEWTLAGY